VIHASRDGDARIRSRVPLSGPAGLRRLSPLQGDAPGLLAVPEIPAPVVAPDAPAHPIGMPETYLYEWRAEAGQRYAFAFRSDQP
jgi:hypothetical protein